MECFCRTNAVQMTYKCISRTIHHFFDVCTHVYFRKRKHSQLDISSALALALLPMQNHSSLAVLLLGQTSKHTCSTLIKEGRRSSGESGCHRKGRTASMPVLAPLRVTKMKSSVSWVSNTIGDKDQSHSSKIKSLSLINLIRLRVFHLGNSSKIWAPKVSCLQKCNASHSVIK